eukprot:scaffold16569_cov60-Phaeocystis_antarctica.AAC.1
MSHPRRACGSRAAARVAGAPAAGEAGRGAPSEQLAAAAAGRGAPSPSPRRSGLYSLWPYSLWPYSLWLYLLWRLLPVLVGQGRRHAAGRAVASERVVTLRLQGQGRRGQTWRPGCWAGGRRLVVGAAQSRQARPEEAQGRAGAVPKRQHSVHAAAPAAAA